jgi:hypothetical protein
VLDIVPHLSYECLLPPLVTRVDSVYYLTIENGAERELHLQIQYTKGPFCGKKLHRKLGSSRNLLFIYLLSQGLRRSSRADAICLLAGNDYCKIEHYHTKDTAATTICTYHCTPSASTY